MKKKEVEKYLEKGFKEKFKIKSVKKDKYRFIILIKDLYIRFLCASVDSDLSFPSTFSYSIGTKKNRNVLRIIFPERYNLKENIYPLSIGTAQTRLFDEGKYPILEYDIYTEEDAQRMVDEVSDYILNSVLPEWEANPTLEYLEKKVNEKLVDVPNFSGLILAKLVKNPNYEIIKAHFVEVSKDWAEWDKEDLQKVIFFLDSKSQEELLEISEMK